MVRIERERGGVQEIALTAFAEADRAQLQRWMEQVAADPQVALNERLLAAKSPAILFVGNSYSSDVPKAFEQLAKREGRAVLVEQVTVAGRSLAQAAADADTLAKIKRGKWDVVVLQEQSLIPAFPPAQRDAQMMPALKRLVGEVRQAGALPVLYETWARRDGDRENAAVFPNDTFQAMDARLSECFKAARQTNPTLTGVPVGHAWAARMKDGKGATLYNPQDGSHPSAQGIHLAAAVFYTTFFNTPVAKAPGDIDDAVALNALAGRLGLRQLPAYPLPAE